MSHTWNVLSHVQIPAECDSRERLQLSVGPVLLLNWVIFIKSEFLIPSPPRPRRKRTLHRCKVRERQSCQFIQRTKKIFFRTMMVDSSVFAAHGRRLLRSGMHEQKRILVFLQGIYYCFMITRTNCRFSFLKAYYME